MISIKTKMIGVCHPNNPLLDPLYPKKIWERSLISLREMIAGYYQMKEREGAELNGIESPSFMVIMKRQLLMQVYQKHTDCLD